MAVNPDELEQELVDTEEEKGHEYLTFSLAGEEYGVDILRVQAIRGWEPVTRVPNSAFYMKGVVNLRGSIVPIIDMRERFDMEHKPYSPTTVVIVLQVEVPSGNRVMGIVVDAVSDVVNATMEDIRTTPDFGTKVNTEFISGLAAAAEGKMIMLLDVDRLLNVPELMDESANDDDDE